MRWNDAGDAAWFAKTFDIRYPLGDAGSAAEALASSRYGIPLVFVLDRDGSVVDFALGYLGTRTDRWLVTTVEKALERTAAHPSTPVNKAVAINITPTVCATARARSESGPSESFVTVHGAGYKFVDAWTDNVRPIRLFRGITFSLHVG